MHRPQESQQAHQEGRQKTLPQKVVEFISTDLQRAVMTIGNPKEVSTYVDTLRMNRNGKLKKVPTLWDENTEHAGYCWIGAFPDWFHEFFQDKYYDTPFLDGCNEVLATLPEGTEAHVVTSNAMARLMNGTDVVKGSLSPKAQKTYFQDRWSKKHPDKPQLKVTFLEDMPEHAHLFSMLEQAQAPSGQGAVMENLFPTEPQEADFLTEGKTSYYIASLLYQATLADPYILDYIRKEVLSPYLCELSEKRPSVLYYGLIEVALRLTEYLTKGINIHGGGARQQKYDLLLANMFLRPTTEKWAKAHDAVAPLRTFIQEGYGTTLKEFQTYYILPEQNPHLRKKRQGRARMRLAAAAGVLIGLPSYAANHFIQHTIRNYEQKRIQQVIRKEQDMLQNKEVSIRICNRYDTRDVENKQVSFEERAFKIHELIQSVIVHIRYYAPHTDISDEALHLLVSTYLRSRYGLHCMSEWIEPIEVAMGTLRFAEFSILPSNKPVEFPFQYLQPLAPAMETFMQKYVDNTYNFYHRSAPSGAGAIKTGKEFHSLLVNFPEHPTLPGIHGFTQTPLTYEIWKKDDALFFKDSKDDITKDTTLYTAYVLAYENITNTVNLRTLWIIQAMPGEIQEVLSSKSIFIDWKKLQQPSIPIEPSTHYDLYYEGDFSDPYGQFAYNILVTRKDPNSPYLFFGKEKNTTSPYTTEFFDNNIRLHLRRIQEEQNRKTTMW